MIVTLRSLTLRTCWIAHVSSIDEKRLFPRHLLTLRLVWGAIMRRLLRWILSFGEFSLQFLVFLHLVLGLRSVARFAI